jgi:1,3-beta-glucan synthase
LYFILLILFIVLLIGPVIVRKYITSLPSIPLDLLQPTGQNNNDTFASVTGSVLVPGLGGDGSGATATGGGGGGGAAATTGGSGGDAFGSTAFGLGGGGGRFVKW